MIKLIIQLQCLLLAWTAQGCMYTFSSTAYTMNKLHCNPHDCQLELYCAVSGPVSPGFHLHWYFSSSDNGSPSRLETSMDGYHISSTQVDVTVGLQQRDRSISSVLKLEPVSQIHANHCMWCQVDFDEHSISLSRDNYKLCLGDGGKYRTLPACDNLITFDASSFCATLDDFDFPDLKASQSVLPENAVPNLESVSPSPTLVLPLPSPTEPRTLPHTSRNTELATVVDSFPSITAETTSSNYRVHVTASSTGMSVAHTISDLGIAATRENATTTSDEPKNTNPDNQNNSVEGGLFVAIAICILFIIIIIILMYFVVRLFRQWKLKRENNSNEDENEAACPGSNTAAPAVLAHGYSVERFQVDSESLFLSNLDEDGNGILTTRSLQDLSAKRQIVPPLPPKPWRKNMIKASSVSKLQSGSLSHGYNNFSFPQHTLDGRQEQFMELTVPPPVPVRSKSREHFYHTLECSNKDSGLDLAMENTLKQQVEELFDDPRYVVVTVEEPRGRKGLWSSTPALSSTQLSERVAGRERHSLRLTHAVGTEIYN